MSILGIGNDIVEIDRIQALLEHHPVKFLDKLLTEKEKLEFKKRNESILYIAGRFTAKEAIVKALGTGFGEIGFHDIEVLADAKGKPNVYFSDALRKKIEKSQIMVSISHCKNYATAVAIWMN